MATRIVALIFLLCAGTVIGASLKTEKMDVVKPNDPARTYVDVDADLSINGGIQVDEVSNDDTLVDDSGTAIVTEAAVKGYVDTALGLLDFGDVYGPSSSVARQVLVAADASGKLLEGSNLFLQSVINGTRLSTNSTDGNDDQSMTFTPAGGLDSNRGAWLGLYGNEHSAKAGDIAFALGSSGSSDFDISDSSESLFNLNNSGDVVAGNSSGTSSHIFNGVFNTVDQFLRSLTFSGTSIISSSSGGDSSITLQHEEGGRVLDSDGTITVPLGSNPRDTNIMNSGSFELGFGELTCTDCELSLETAFSPTHENRFSVRATFAASTGKVCFTKTTSDYEGHKLVATITVKNSNDGVYFKAQRNGADIAGIQRHVTDESIPEIYTLPQFFGGGTSLGWCLEATESITGFIDFDNAFIGAGGGVETATLVKQDDIIMRAAGNADSVVVTGNTTNIPFTEINDVANAWNGSQYTVPVKGIYSISAGVYSNSDAGRIVSLYVNGTLYRNLMYNNVNPYQGTLIDEFQAGDVLSLRVNVTSTLLNLVNRHYLIITHQGSLETIPAAKDSTAVIRAGAISMKGYEGCDPHEVPFGSVLSRTDYAELFAVIGETWGEGDGSTTFNTPPAGYFARFADLGAGNDPDAATRTACATGGANGDEVGTCQADAFQGHWHTQPPASGSGTGSPFNRVVFGSGAATGVPIAQDAITDGVNGTPRTASETRAKNSAYQGCVSFKTIRVVAELSATAFAAKTATTVATANVTPINYTTVLGDTHNAYSAGTYTIPSSGWYRIHGQTYTGANHTAFIYVNGVNEAQGGSLGSASVASTVTALLPLVAGNTIQIRLDQSQTILGGALLNRFSVSKEGN